MEKLFTITPNIQSTAGWKWLFPTFTINEYQVLYKTFTDTLWPVVLKRAHNDVSQGLAVTINYKYISNTNWDRCIVFTSLLFCITEVAAQRSVSRCKRKYWISNAILMQMHLHVKWISLKKLSFFFKTLFLNFLIFF